jgi:hypothetical protein
MDGSKTYFHYCRSIVGDCLLAVAVNKQQVSSVRSESALDCRLHCDTGIDIRKNLALSLRGIRAWKQMQSRQSVLVQTDK